MSFPQGNAQPLEYELSRQGGGPHRPLPPVPRSGRSERENSDATEDIVPPNISRRRSTERSPISEPFTPPEDYGSQPPFNPYSIPLPPPISIHLANRQPHTDSFGQPTEPFATERLYPTYPQLPSTELPDSPSSSTSIPSHTRAPSGAPLLFSPYQGYQEQTIVQRRPARSDHDQDYAPSRYVMAWRAEVNLPQGMTLSEQRNTSLAEIDNAKFSRFHLKVSAIAGVGFFTDAYDIFSINIASTILAYVYTSGQQLRFSGSQDSVIKAAAPLGTFVGQLFFGVMADQIGRKRMYGIELIIIIIATFGQALTANDSLGTVSIIWALAIWRFIMGLGIGGDYPLSAIITSEFSAVHIRGRMMTAVFANQGWGQICASVVALVAIIGTGSKVSDHISPVDPTLLAQLDRAWRILVGLGGVPAAIALYFRLTIPESPRFTMDVERNVKQAVEDIERFLSTGTYKFDPDSVIVRVNAPKASLSDFKRYFSKWSNLSVLLCCAYAWFAIDVTFYGLGLNTDKLFNAVGFAPYVTVSGATKCVPPDGSTCALAFNSASDVLTYFRNLCEANMLLSAAGLIPGYWVTFLFIDHKRFGRKPIQLIGFGMLSVLFVIMAAAFDKMVAPSDGRLVPSLFAVEHGGAVLLTLFCLVGFFQNFGPNTTTFVIPGEIFPTRYRSTCHGISAASGKVGAIISQFGLTQISTTKNILWSYLPFTITGLLATLPLPETRETTLEDNSNEEQDFFIKGPVKPEPSPS